MKKNSLHFLPLAFLIILIGFSFLPAREKGPFPDISLPTEPIPNLPASNLKIVIPRTPKVALVLSGGGARGIAHIGVLKALEEARIPVHLIVGSSIGSVVGGFYAAGYSLQDLLDLMRTIDWQNLYSEENERLNLFWSQKTDLRRHVLELRFDKGIPYIPSALTQGQKIFNLIYSRLMKTNFQAGDDFNNLRIPFRAVATDIISGKRVVLKEGDLAEAITASITFPLLFAPVEWNGMWLVDGGIRDNLPVEVAIENGADLKIVVDVTSPLRSVEDMKAPWQLADQVTSIMMQDRTEKSRGMADVLIEPDLGSHKAGDYSRLDSLVDAGYQALKIKIDSIRERLWQSKNELWGINAYLGKTAEVVVEGLNHVNLDSLKSGMSTRPGSSLYRYDIMQDLMAFYNSGYIADAQAALEGEPHGYRVVFHLKEYPTVCSIEIDSRLKLIDSLLLKQLQWDLPFVLNSRILAKRLDNIRRLYVRQGFGFAKILSVNYQQENEKLVIKIDEGLLEKIEIQGNHSTKSYIISREFPIHEGDVFQSDLAVEGIRNIHSTGLFEKVTLRLSRKGGINRAIIKVKEKKYLLMRFGGNASLERKGQASMEIAEDNLFGRAMRAYLWGSIGETERRAEFNLYSLRMFRTLLTYRFSLYYRERWDRYYTQFTRTGDYTTIRRGIRFELGQQIERLGSISVRLRWDQIGIHSSESTFHYRDHYRIRSLTFSSVVDKRDKLPFPDSGIFNQWAWETGNQRLLGSSEAFTRFFISLEGYYPLISNLIFHVKASGGSADLTLPFSEFFSLGGIDDFPGLYEREIFGRQMLHVSGELRHKIRWRIPIDFYLGLNYHLGTVWKSSEDPIRREDFLTSIGGYLAVNSIFGPIRLVHGRLNGVRSLWYFSIGYNL